MNRCPEHPKYGAIRKPGTPCPMCWAIYLTMHSELFESTGMRVIWAGQEPDY